MLPRINLPSIFLRRAGSAPQSPLGCFVPDRRPRCAASVIRCAGVERGRQRQESRRQPPPRMMINDRSYCHALLARGGPVHAAFQKIPLGKMLGKRRLGAAWGIRMGRRRGVWCFHRNPPACALVDRSSIHPSIPFIHQSNPSVFRAYRSGAWQLPTRQTSSRMQPGRPASLPRG